MTESQLHELLGGDNTIVSILAVRQAEGGWEYLIKTTFVFPVFAICWTDGEFVRRTFGCFREETARREWSEALVEAKEVQCTLPF